MSAKVMVTITLCSLFALSACARNEPAPAQITYQPTFDKFGNQTGCEGDGVYSPGSNYVNECEPPQEECDLYATSAFPCQPYMDDDGGDPRQGRNPNGPTSRVP